MWRASLLGLVPASARTVVPFQYAWRFHYGDDVSVEDGDWPAGPGTCSFEEDLQDFPICEGMEHAPNRFSEKDCRTACCYDPNCLVWQAFNIENGRECYHGYKGSNITCTPGSKKSLMGGGRRSESPSPAFRTDYVFAGDDADIDKSWDVVDAPHDFIAERGNFTDDSTNFKQGYMPRNVSWYRKHFSLPSEWKDGGRTHVHFEGVFHRAEIYLNGEFLQVHDCGYTGFTVRLDNASNVRYGDGKSNILAVRADASYGSGHWYEGGGLYRLVHLVHTGEVHFVHDGVFVPPEVENERASVEASAELEGSSGKVVVEFRMTDESGDEVASNRVTVDVPADGTREVKVQLVPSSLNLWSVQSPVLYNVMARILSQEGKQLDTFKTRVGFRKATWGVDPGFSMNGEAFKLRGFSHHNSMGGLGVAIPERVNLFRVQASRAMGANVWRTSHNPYSPALYDLLDATGTLCWDENRDYGVKYGGGIYAEAMRDMVKRGRNHPSIVVWSICNEFECKQMDAESSAKAFSEAAKSVDPTRAVSGNTQPPWSTLDNATRYLDVVGFSHKDNASFEEFHAENPQTPSVLSECCSCSSQRIQRDELECIAEENSPGLLPYVAGSLGVWTLMDYFGEPVGTGTSSWPVVSSNFGQFDIAGFPKTNAYWYPINWLQAFEATEAGRPALAASTVTRILDLPDRLSAFSPSIAAVTSAPYAELFVDGKSLGKQATPRDRFGQARKLTWSLPPKLEAQCTGPESFPHNVSGFQCMGFSKVDAADPDSCAKACCAEQLCNTWQFDVSELAKGCWIGSAPFGSCRDPPEGNKGGVKMVGGQRELPYSPFFSSVTLKGLSKDGTVLGTHTLHSPTVSGKRRLRLTTDVPSETTGTGRALILDGRDTAMLRASVVEPVSSKSSVPGLFLAAGEDDFALVSTASNRITWRVVSGPGRVIGVSSGDEASHEWLKSNSVNAYAGLARGYVQVTRDCVSEHRDLAAKIDRDAGLSPVTVAKSCEDDTIIVEASAEGFEPMRMSIPVTTDLSAAPLAVAASTATSNFRFTYMDDFLG